MTPTAPDANRILADRLRELGNIASGQALRALGEITNTRFSIRVPEIELVSYNSMPRLIGDAEDGMVGVLIDVYGDICGVFILLLRPDTVAGILSGLGVEPAKDFQAAPKRAKSALMEMGNIMCSSYMTAVYEMTRLKTRLMPPSYAADMLGAILTRPMIRFAMEESNILYIENVFTIEDTQLLGSILLLPEIESAQTLAKRLGELI